MPHEKPREKLMLFDAMSLVFRAFFAPMQTALVSPAGLPTKAIYIFVRTLRKLLKDHRPEHVAVAFDLTAPTFRDKLFETYKANRPAFPEDLTLQLPYVRRFCAALGLPIVEREGFEADDIMGTLAREGEALGFDVFLVTGDEDLFQLVNERVRVLKPSRGAEQPEVLCDAAKVEEILGVRPAQVVDWLALTGDTSDNIPGARPLPGKEAPLAPGAKKRSYIGPKGATELIRRFGMLDAVLANYAQIERQSYREALRDFRAEALLSRDLATIRTDVALEIHAADLRARPTDVPELVALCRELGFSSMLREFLDEAPAPPASAGPEFEELRAVEAVAGWVQGLAAQAPIAIALGVEGGEGFSGHLAALAITDGLRRALVPLDAAPGLLGALGPALEGPGRPRAVHNSKLLRLLLAKSGISLGAVEHDTLLYAYLLEPLAGSDALSDVALRRFGRKLSGSLAEAAEATRELAGLLLPEMVQEGLKPLYDQIELPLSAALAEVEATGVRIDPLILAQMSHEFDRKLTELTGEIYDLAGGAFEIDSPRQLGEVLFEKLKLPGGKKLKKSGQYSTEASVLEALASRHELPRKILDYRTRAKLKSTYIDALPRYIDAGTGRLHSSFNQAGSRTGRLSSSNPNLQNIPIGDEFSMLIRSAFVADEGSRLISADYSQIELRVLAHLSSDPVLIEAFSRDEDIHARTAREIFGVVPALQSHDHRRMAKAINYGVIYGLSAFGLAERTGSSRTEAQQYIDAYFRRYPKVKDYVEGSVEEARRTGRVRTLFGRLRPMPDINSRDVPARNRAEREAMNTPLQGTAADLLKLAMVKAQARLEREALRTRMILTVHDELVFEAPEGELDAAKALVKEEMEGVWPVKVPLRVDLGIGRNWREAK
ncbi:MAG TPA: DNA polymerase I [Terriglobia bacterium]|nr:DNA polymerase I [Terriglobia bacterium]